ncbi:hypothetical protein OC834_001483 [Tilletia horrida]|nr:hypothetical protein OC834_001483 [Tilletia horrida]KAK0566323.1 hypothetical protein OC844_000784 [Tilletia horrida]
MRTTSTSALRAVSTALAATFAILNLLAAPVAAGDCTYGDKRCAGQYQVINTNSVASAMMMGLLNQHTVWILDKTEGNPTLRPNGQPYWGSFLDLTTNKVVPAVTFTNAFCAGGTTLGNGTWLVAGGNQPVDQGGNATQTAQLTGVYRDGDGRKAVRIIEPNNYYANSSQLSWFDNYSPDIANNPGVGLPVNGTGLQMQSYRWYPGVEPYNDGSAVLIGGANNGGYINRNTPNTDPAFEYPPGQVGNLDGNNLFYGGANPTYEFWPPKGELRIVNFMNKTSGLNMYPHTFLMPDGRIFMQANFSTVLWDPIQNIEEDLPDMPDQIIRVYPASGAVAMLPLTPENDYTPTILFCGGTILDEPSWGNYTSPATNVLNVDASKDCSSITPVDSTGKTIPNVQYDREEQMSSGRSMGQFIHLADGTLLNLNGAHKGTAGYANVSWNIINPGQPNEVRTEGLSQNPAYQPIIYDPSKPKGSRLSSKGLGSSDYERLYHSSAILIPDGSVLVAGSNPHQDVALTMPLGTSPQAFNTSYVIEKFYPPYYFETRPQPQGLPTFIPYGGKTFTVTIDAGYMGTYSNWRAAATKFRLVRTGFSTHAMNMGQRSLVLPSTYVVNSDGSVTYTVSPMPPNANLFAPGPAMLFADVDGIPSYGQMVQVGWPSANFAQAVPYNFPTGVMPTLSAAVNNSMYNEIPPEAKGDGGVSIAKIIIIAAVAAGAVLLLLLGFFCWRRRRNGAMLGGSGGPGGKRAKMPTGYAPTPGGAWQPSGKAGMLGSDYEPVGGPGANFVAPNSQFRGSMGTFDSFKMQDRMSSPGPGMMMTAAGAGAGAAGGLAAGGAMMHSPGGRPSESREALGAYFDHPRGGSSPAPSRSPLGRYDDASGMGSPAYSTRELPSDLGRSGTPRVGSAGSGMKAQEAALLSPYGYQPYDDGYQQPDAYGGAQQQPQQPPSSQQQQQQQQQIAPAQQQALGGGYGQSLSPGPNANMRSPMPVQQQQQGAPGGAGGYYHSSTDGYAPSGMSHGSEQAFYDASASNQANSFYGHGGR